MPPPEQELSEQERKKKTVWLMAGGAVSLLLPLLGVFYLHWSANAGARGPSGRNDLFEHREGGDRRLTPSQMAVAAPTGMTPPPSSLPTGGKTETPTGSSLDFIKPNDELAAKFAEPPKTATAPAAAPAVAPAATAAQASHTAPKAKAKKGPKEFTMPKLQPSRGFTNFNSGKKGAATGAAMPQGAAGAGDAGDLLKNLPPGAENNPQVQEYLKSHGAR